MTMFPTDPVGGFPSGDPVGPLPGEAAPAPLPGDVGPQPLPGDVAPAQSPGDVIPAQLPGDVAPAPLPGEDVAPAARPAPQPSAAPPAPPQHMAPPPTLPSDAAPPPPPFPQPPQGPPTYPGGRAAPPAKPPQGPGGSQQNSSQKAPSKGMAAIGVIVMLVLAGPAMSSIFNGSDDSDTDDQSVEHVEAETFFVDRLALDSGARAERVEVWDNDCDETGLQTRMYEFGCQYGIEALYERGTDDLRLRQHVLVFDTPEDATDVVADADPALAEIRTEFHDAEPTEDEAAQEFSPEEFAIDVVGGYVVISASELGGENDGEGNYEAFTAFHDNAIERLDS